jgi:hypothetical protein
MRVLCAWCEKYLETKPPFKDDRISHSICPSCERNFLKQLACPWPKGVSDDPTQLPQR